METIVVNVTGDGIADYIQSNASTIEYAFSSEPPTQNGFDTVLTDDPSHPGGVREDLVPHMEGGEIGDGFGTAEDVFKKAIAYGLCDGAQAQGVTLTPDQADSMAEIALYSYAPGASNGKIYDALYQKIVEGVRNGDIVKSLVQWCKTDLRLLSYSLDASTGDFIAMAVNQALPSSREASVEDTPIPSSPSGLKYRTVTVSFTMPNYNPEPYIDSDGEEVDDGKDAYVEVVEDALRDAIPSAFSDFKAAYLCLAREIYYQVQGFGMLGYAATANKIPAPGASGSVSIKCGYGVWNDMAFILFPILENAEPYTYGMAYFVNDSATYEGLWDVIQSGGDVSRYLY